MYKLVTFIIFFIISHQSLAALSTYTKPENVVVFVNGISNSYGDASDSYQKLRSLVDTESSALSLFYNTENGYYYDNGDLLTGGDIVELKYQAGFSDVALVASGVNNPESLLTDSTRKLQYYKELGGIYFSSLDSSDPIIKRIAETTMKLATKLSDYSKLYNRVIVVAHSQGNFYIESAYATLIYQNNLSAIDKIRVVGVASVAATTPNNTYLSHAMDEAVYHAQWINTLATSVYKPLKHTDTMKAFKVKAPPLHSFNDIYLSNDVYSIEKENKLFPLIIRDYIFNFFYPKSLLKNSTVTSTASCGSLQNGAPEIIVDGNFERAHNLCTYSGIVNITPPAPVTLKKLIIRPEMTPDGSVTYEVQTYSSTTGWVSHGIATNVWKNHQDIEVDLSTTNSPISEIAITVHGSPSWVSYLEIQGF